MHEIRFQISQEVSITFFTYVPEEKLHLYSSAYVSLQRSFMPDLMISREKDVFCPMDDFLYKLLAITEGELELHPALVNNCIGSMYNNFYQKSLQEFADEDGCWIGGKHLLWINPDNNVVTLVYSCDKKFFFEMSPSYPWKSDYVPQPGDGYIPYDEYMKTYEPIAILEFARESALQWIDHINKLQKLMYENWERWQHEEAY